MFQENFIEFVLFRYFEETFRFESPICARYVRIYSEYYGSDDYVRCHVFELIGCLKHGTVLPAKSDSNVMFCLQTYHKGSIETRQLKWSVQVNVLSNNCKQNITSLSLNICFHYQKMDLNKTITIPKVDYQVRGFLVQQIL